MNDRSGEWKVAMSEHEGVWSASIWPPYMFGGIALTRIARPNREECEEAARALIENFKSGRSAEGDKIFYVK